MKKMKISRRQLRNLINESMHDIERSKEMTTADRRHDDMEEPLRDAITVDSALGNEIFEFAIEGNGFWHLVDDAYNDGAITEEQADDPRAKENLLSFIRSNFDPEDYKESYERQQKSFGL